VGKPEGRRSFVRPWRRREDNIKMNEEAQTGSIWLRTGTDGRLL
jgi:hypothetical protein